METFNKKKRPKHYTKPKWKLTGRRLKSMVLFSVHMKNKARYFTDKFPLPVYLVISKTQKNTRV